MTKPAWFTQLEHDLNAPLEPDGAAIDWDRCRDLFLISLLQRLEKRSNSPHPAIVRGLLQRRFAGEDVTAALSAAPTWAAAWVAATASATWPVAVWAAALAEPTAPERATWAAWAARAAALAERTAADAERADQLADLRAAVAASTQQPALPDGYIVPTPVDLAALHDPTFSDGLTPSQLLDVLRGGPDPRVLISIVAPTSPAGSLVERVAGSIWKTCDLEIEARAAILEVAAWLTENYASDVVGPSPHQMLRDEANR
jgi:hypothetical protein